MASVELRQATVRYGARDVLDGVDFSVESSARVAIIGPNGSGKTTLLRALAGIVRLGSGTADPADRLPRHALARQLAFLPQDESWEFPFRIEELVQFGRFAHSVSLLGAGSAEDADAVDRALEAVGLLEMRRRPVTQLSGGERRRAALARVLAQRAPMLLLDEPTTALDLEQRQAILRVLRERDGGFVMATHDLDAAATHCDRVVVLRGGRIVGDGTPREMLTAPRLLDVFGVHVRITDTDGRIHVIPDA